MKILQIATGFEIAYNGGITNYVRSLSESLCEEGHEVIVLDSCRTSDTKFCFTQKSITPSKLKPFHFTSAIDNSDTLALEETILSIAPDVIHVHMMLDLPYKALEIFQKVAPTVLSLHDYSWFCNRILYIHDGIVCEGCNNGRSCEHCISSLEANPKLRNLLHKVPILKLLYNQFPSTGHQERYEYFQRIFSEFSSVLAVSSKVKEIYVKNGLQNSNFIVNHIGNITGTDAYRSKFINKKCNAEYSEDVVLGFLGNLSKEKGADILFEIAKRVKNKIRIFGRLMPPYEKEIKKYGNIDYRGPYKQAELERCLNSIDLGLVLPIWEDSAPQVVFEFLNSKIPIIGTQMGGIPDFVISEENGFLVSPDNDGINRIVEIINSPDLVQKVNKMIRRMKGTNTPQSHVEEIQKIYEVSLQNR
jgi:glycosyltransferase involved in cell wall biosynthesis